MSLKNAAALIVAAASDRALDAEVSATVDGKDAEQAAAAFAALATSKGFECTTEEAVQLCEMLLRTAKLSDQGLDKVVGGVGEYSSRDACAVERDAMAFEPEMLAWATSLSRAPTDIDTRIKETREFLMYLESLRSRG